MKKNITQVIDLKNTVEFVRVNKRRISLGAVQISGKNDGYYVVVMPSLGVSGYGTTEDEAQKSFEHNLNLFCEDLLSLSRHEIEMELTKLGFKKEILKNKNFSKVYVDGKGILQNFEEGTANTTVLETTACL